MPFPFAVDGPERKGKGGEYQALAKKPDAPSFDDPQKKNTGQCPAFFFSSFLLSQTLSCDVPRKDSHGRFLCCCNFRTDTLHYLSMSRIGLDSIPYPLCFLMILVESFHSCF